MNEIEMEETNKQKRSVKLKVESNNILNGSYDFFFMIFILHFVNMLYHMIDLHILKNTCITGINHT